MFLSQRNTFGIRSFSKYTKDHLIQPFIWHPLFGLTDVLLATGHVTGQLIQVLQSVVTPRVSLQTIELDSKEVFEGAGSVNSIYTQTC